MSDIENWNNESNVPDDAEQLTCKKMFFTTGIGWEDKPYLFNTATGKREVVEDWDGSQLWTEEEKGSSGWTWLAIFVVAMSALHLLRELYVSVMIN
ncbi:MAG: hypothetical protein CMO01_11945 [Thalassobius sp.]|nr:hypothetical protein [Thalassovita sp.]|tara:strand:+ start:48377 stop:48664 length:288 start_codon:yes stop_codon:yes gene_type:complete